jgi:hypothetical protein
VLLTGGAAAGGARTTGTDPGAAQLELEPEGVVAADVAAVLAEVSDEVVTGAPLTLPLALSVCMERHAVGTGGLIEAMQALRAALLAVSGLDPRAEPTPLVTGDARRAALGLAEYLRDLLARAARASSAAPHVVASAAAAQLA